MNQRLALNLDGVRAKLARANELIDGLDQEMTAWGRQEPWSMLGEFSDDRTTCTYTLSVRVEAPLTRWALLVGDAVHNLRSALDHVVYALAVKDGEKDPPDWETNLQFPIADDDRAFNRHQRRRNRQLRTATNEALRSVQPYNRRESILPSPLLLPRDAPPLLALVRDLDNRDKHRLLAVLLGVATRAFTDSRQTPGVSHRVELQRGPLMEGIEVAVITYSAPVEDVDLEPKIRIDIEIAVEHPPGPAGHTRSEIRGLMRALSAEVSAVVDWIVSTVDV
jgi:hypothetical protein